MNVYCKINGMDKNSPVRYYVSSVTGRVFRITGNYYPDLNLTSTMHRHNKFPVVHERRGKYEKIWSKTAFLHLEDLASHLSSEEIREVAEEPVYTPAPPLLGDSEKIALRNELSALLEKYNVLIEVYGEAVLQISDADGRPVFDHNDSSHIDPESLRFRDIKIDVKDTDVFYISDCDRFMVQTRTSPILGKEEVFFRHLLKELPFGVTETTPEWSSRSRSFIEGLVQGGYRNLSRDIAFKKLRNWGYTRSEEQ